MESRYLNDDECFYRLKKEYEQYGSIIVACDHDNTVYDYHARGDTFEEIIKLLRVCKELKFHITIFTSCNDDRFPEIREYWNKNGIPFDGINETPDFIPFRGRKVYYNILLDDRAGLDSAVRVLWRLVSDIRSDRAYAGILPNGEIA